jgi:hypothetical protein
MTQLPATLTVFFGGPKQLLRNSHTVPALNTLLSSSVPSLIRLLNVLAECSPEHARPVTLSALYQPDVEQQLQGLRQRIIDDAIVPTDERARRLVQAIDASATDDVADVRDTEDGIQWVALHDRHADSSAVAAADQHARIVASNFTRLTLPQAEIENEFQNGAAALSRAFPLVFPLGAKRAFPKDGPIDTSQMRHMLLQFTCAASHQRDLYFYLQDMMRRHATLRSVSGFIHTGKMQSFKDLTDSEPFISLVEQARQGNAEAEATVQSLTRPFIRSAAAAVPNGPAVRKQAVRRIHALSYYLGLPSTWMTMSYDCVASATAIQLSFPTVAADFPLDAFLTAYADGSSLFSHDAWPHRINLTSQGLNSLCSDNPVAAAEVFAAKTAAILEELFGLGPSQAGRTKKALKKTKPSWKSVGIFGTPFGFYLVVEAQGRGALHWHMLYWGRYSPQLLLAASTSNRFKAALETAFGTMTQTEMPRDLHIAKMTERAQHAQGMRVTSPLDRPQRRVREVEPDANAVLKRARCCVCLHPPLAIRVRHSNSVQMLRDSHQRAHSFPDVPQRCIWRMQVPDVLSGRVRPTSSIQIH